MIAAENTEGVLHDPGGAALVSEALRAGSVGLWAWDLVADRLFVDAVARRLWGLPASGPVRAADIFGRVDPEDAETFRQAIAVARQTGEANDVVARVRDPGGDLRWIRLRGHVEPTDRRRLTGVLVDITARMEAQSALGATEARLRRAQELGGALAFEWEAGTNQLIAAPGFRSLYGLKPDEPLNRASLLAHVHPDDRARVDADLQRILTSARSFEMDFRVMRPGGSHRWLLTRGEVVRDGMGAVTGIAGVSLDITERKQIEDDLRRARKEAQARFRELEALYQHAPVGLALLDRDFRFVRINESLAALTGLRAARLVGRPIFQALPDLRPDLEPVLAGLVAHGHAIRDVAIEGVMPGRPGAKVSWRAHGYLVRSDRGKVIGLGLVVEDVTARVAAERARDLLARELGHRIKNMFAVIASMITLSARGNPAVQGFARTVRERIEALGRAQDLVNTARPGEDVMEATRSLHALIGTLLAPYRREADEPPGDQARITIQGCDPEVGASAATALALALHEFATNAVKYGALSAAEGSVSVTCRDDGACLEIVWQERGGPVIAGPPAREGFGTQLARRSLGGELGGSVAHEWDPDGVTIRIRAPMERLAR